MVAKNYTQYKELKPFQNWYNKNRKNPIFKHLLAVAYRNWKELDYINNKVVKKEATSIGASSGPGSAVGAPPAVGLRVSPLGSICTEAS